VLNLVSLLLSNPVLPSKPLLLLDNLHPLLLTLAKPRNLMSLPASLWSPLLFRHRVILLGMSAMEAAMVAVMSTKMKAVMSTRTKGDMSTGMTRVMSAVVIARSTRRKVVSAGSAVTELHQCQAVLEHELRKQCSFASKLTFCLQQLSHECEGCECQECGEHSNGCLFSHQAL
jgi:hypothetical protein